MAKRNKKTVVGDRWARKEQEGRKVKHEDKSEVKASVTAKNQVQKEFLRALKEKECVVFIAPAGVGKSFLTMCECTDWIKRGLYDRMVMTRPAVGMGKTLGLLPGDIREKFENYLLPMVDVIKKRYGTGFYESSLSNGVIEFAPLEYIRGRNFDCLVVVDEFQNCTPDDAYTMLTRVQEGGKLILIGDPTQNDMNGENALQWLPKFIRKNPELKEHIKIITATSDDIVRGGLCKKMVQAKERYNKR